MHRSERVIGEQWTSGIGLVGRRSDVADHANDAEGSPAGLL
jgi:hypothetical protein